MLRIDYIPARADGTYFSYNNFDTPNPGMLQIPHDGAIKGTFDTLQVIDDVYIPNGKWNTADYPEPITKDYPKYGPGGATQAITHKEIKLDSLEDLRNNKRGKKMTDINTEYYTQEEISWCKEILLKIVGKDNIIDINLAINQVLGLVYAKGGGGKQEIYSYVETMYEYKDPRIFGKKISN
ncbi:MAG: hypothetical protein J6M05_06775 [Cardiobacteriaceae bacterium]|nr:hypothetical protein [Cardiobacteriaceae bacterium]